MFKVNIKFILLSTAAFIFAYIQGGNLPYRIFYGFLLTFAISFVYIIVKQRSIVVQIKFNRKIYSAGEEEEFITIVKNYGILPAPYVIIKNKTLATLNPSYNGDALWLNFDDNRWIKSTVKFHQRGIYNFGELNLKVSDLFSIFERNKNLNYNIPIKVYPRVYELLKFTARGSDIFKNAISSATSMEDIYSVKDIRKYNEGDNLKRVNWKVSAKHGELYVKNMETVSGEESNIFLDMSKFNVLTDEQGIEEEQLIDLCVSIINYMNIKGIKTRIFINSAESRSFQIESREDFNELMEFFLTQKSNSDSSFTDFIYANSNKIPKLSWIGIITAGVSRNLKDGLINMRDRGYNITVFHSIEGLKDLSNMEMLKKTGIECYSFYEIIKDEKSKVNI